MLEAAYGFWSVRCIPLLLLLLVVVVVVVIVVVVVVSGSSSSRSQWPRVLRRRSTAARLLRSWVRIPPGTWLFVVSVVCCQVEVSATS